MRVVFLCVGSLKDPFRDLAAEYEKRLSKYWRCEIVELRESSNRSENEALRKRIEKFRAGSARIISLDARGVQYSSDGFAEFLRQQKFERVVFVLGGSEGLDAQTLRSCDSVLSLGLLTWTHQLARVLLLEQVYRAEEISRGTKYHK